MLLFFFYDHFHYYYIRKAHVMANFCCYFSIWNIYIYINKKINKKRLRHAVIEQLHGEMLHATACRGADLIEIVATIVW